MPHLIKDCECEDWPLCQHADNYVYSADEFDEAFYCSDCGIAHTGMCKHDLEEDDEEMPEEDMPDD